jgi:hypothetical protein
MLRAPAHLRKAELLENAANRHLVQINVEALLDDAPQILCAASAASPANRIGGRCRD